MSVFDTLKKFGPQKLVFAGFVTDVPMRVMKEDKEEKRKGKKKNFPKPPDAALSIIV